MKSLINTMVLAALSIAPEQAFQQTAIATRASVFSALPDVSFSPVDASQPVPAAEVSSEPEAMPVTIAVAVPVRTQPAPVRLLEVAVATSPVSAVGVVDDLLVESTEVTENGSVEYALRGTLKTEATGEIVAVAHAASADVQILADRLYFVRQSGDIGALSQNALRVRIPGGMSFDPSMLSWVVKTKAEPLALLDSVVLADTVLGPEAQD